MNKPLFYTALYMAIIVQFLLPLMAQADIGLPMLILVWPASWALLLVIIPLEAMIAKRLLGFTTSRSFILSSAANAFSTIIGIPVTWLILVFGEIMIARFLPMLHLLNGFNLDVNGWQMIRHAVLGSPWLAPPSRGESGEAWIIPVALISLCVPFCLASIWTENLIAKHFVSDKTKAFRWACAANISSYGLIVIILLIVLFIDLLLGLNY